MSEINWSTVHDATEALLHACKKIKRQASRGVGCTNDELIQALNNVRATLEAENTEAQCIPART
jgi:hypothetical protein